MTDDLLPCPFCGSRVAMSVLEDDAPGEILSAWVECSRCGIEIKERRTEVDAAAQWNRRATKLQARLPDGGDWTDIFPAQLQPMAKNGCDVRAIEASPPSPAHQTPIENKGGGQS